MAALLITLSHGAALLRNGLKAPNLDELNLYNLRNLVDGNVNYLHFHLLFCEKNC